MTGLFLRLARQATGQPRNPVHAALPLHYRPNPSPAPDEPAPALFGGVIPRTPAPAPRAPVAARQEHDVESAPGLASDPLVGVVDIPADMRQQQRARSPHDEGVDPPLSVAHPQQGPASPERNVPRAGRAHAPATGAINSAAAEPGDRYREDDLQPPSASATMRNMSQAMPPETSPPEPLLASTASANAVNRLTAGQTPAAQSTAPDEVHVHIGRIEITALVPAAAPKTKRPAARQPMSLDDYLARRGQRGR